MAYQDDPDKAERAIEEARRSATETDSIIRQAQKAMEANRQWREENHFTIKLREIFHGA